MYRKISLGLFAAYLCIAWTYPLLAATIVSDKKFPTQNEQVRLVVSDSDGNPVGGASVTVTYRPGSSVEKTDTLGESDAAGVVMWKPSDAGIATVTATWSGPEQSELSESTTVSVRFQSAPWNGIIIMIIAGLVLAVGSIVRIFRLLRSPEIN
jgi:hypothetical protein